MRFDYFTQLVLCDFPKSICSLSILELAVFVFEVLWFWVKLVEDLYIVLLQLLYSVVMGGGGPERCPVNIPGDDDRCCR